MSDLLAPRNRNKSWTIGWRAGIAVIYYVSNCWNGGYHKNTCYQVEGMDLKTTNTNKSLYKMRHYITDSILNSLKMEPKMLYLNKMYRLVWSKMVIYLYNLHIFLWIQLGYFTNSCTRTNTVETWWSKCQFFETSRFFKDSSQSRLFMLLSLKKIPIFQINIIWKIQFFKQNLLVPRSSN